MFGMSHESYLLLDAVVTIIGLIVLITKFKVHPFIALIIAAGFLGLTSGMPVDKIIKAFQDGFGGLLGFVGIILALGTMLGKMMAESGGADQIAQTLIRAFGNRIQIGQKLARRGIGPTRHARRPGGRLPRQRHRRRRQPRIDARQRPAIGFVRPRR